MECQLTEFIGMPFISIRSLESQCVGHLRSKMTNVPSSHPPLNTNSDVDYKDENENRNVNRNVSTIHWYFTAT